MEVEIKDVVALTGQPGLFRVVKADDRAIVVESLDDRKKRQLVKGNMVVSKLVDVSMYTETESEILPVIFERMKEKHGESLPVSKKSSKDELMSFLEAVLPDYDREKVYPSNVKKLISWYNILIAEKVDLSYDPDADAAEENSEGEAAEPEKAEEAAAE